MLRPKLTEILLSYRALETRRLFYTSAIPEVTWYKPLYKTY